MKRAVRISLLVAVTLLAGGALGSLCRGVYDQLFMLEGRFHVVNTAEKDLDVLLRFPSGEQRSFQLKRAYSTDFVLRNTGEGSITVMVDGQQREQIGYVTSRNSLIVLAIGDENTLFSQVFTSLHPNEPAASNP